MELIAYKEMLEQQSEHWWFVARSRVLDHLMKRFCTPVKKILEVGAGTGSNLQFLKRYGKVSVLEPNDYAIECLKAHQDINIIQDFAPSSKLIETFDLIAAIDVIEHIDDDKAVVKFLADSLNKNGKVLITVPAFNFLWSAHDETLHHQRRYRKKQLENLFREAGFKINLCSYFNFFLFPLAFAIRLLDKLIKGSGEAGNSIPHPVINSVFKKIFEFEKYLLPNICLPFGLSIILIGEKIDKN